MYAHVCVYTRVSAYLLIDFLPEGHLLTKGLNIVLEVHLSQCLCLQGFLHGIQSATDLVQLCLKLFHLWGGGGVECPKQNDKFLTRSI